MLSSYEKTMLNKTPNWQLTNLLVGHQQKKKKQNCKANDNTFNNIKDKTHQFLVQSCC